MLRNFRARHKTQTQSVLRASHGEPLMPRTAEPWRREELVALERSEVEGDRQIVDRRQGFGSCAKFIAGVANLFMESNPQRPGQAQGPAGSTSQKQRRVCVFYRWLPGACRRRHNRRVEEANSRNKRPNRPAFVTDMQPFKRAHTCSRPRPRRGTSVLPHERGAYPSMYHGRLPLGGGE